MSQTDPELNISTLREELESIEEGDIVLINFNSANYSDMTIETLRFFLNEKGAGVTCITASKPYFYVSKVMESRKINKENLLFIDCITNLAPAIVPKKTENCIFVENPAALEEMSMHTANLMKRLQAKNKLLFVDSLSTILIYNNANSLREFLHFITSILRKNGFGGIFVTINGHSNDRITELFGLMCDKVITV